MAPTSTLPRQPRLRVLSRIRAAGRAATNPHRLREHPRLCAHGPGRADARGCRAPVLQTQREARAGPGCVDVARRPGHARCAHARQFHPSLATALERSIRPAPPSPPALHRATAAALPARIRPQTLDITAPADKYSSTPPAIAPLARRPERGVSLSGHGPVDRTSGVLSTHLSGTIATQPLQRAGISAIAPSPHTRIFTSTRTPRRRCPGHP